jgi:hypothetical protein
MSQSLSAVGIATFWIFLGALEHGLDDFWHLGSGPPPLPPPATTPSTRIGINFLLEVDFLSIHLSFLEISVLELVAGHCLGDGLCECKPGTGPSALHP